MARAQTIDDGYALKSEYTATALEPLGLSALRIGFFNAFGDDPARLRSLLSETLGEIRDAFRARLREDLASARLLLANHEKEQVREVPRAAATMLSTWVTQHGTVPALSGHAALPQSLLTACAEQNLRAERAPRFDSSRRQFKPNREIRGVF